MKDESGSPPSLVAQTYDAVAGRRLNLAGLRERCDPRGVEVLELAVLAAHQRLTLRREGLLLVTCSRPLTPWDGPALDEKGVLTGEDLLVGLLLAAHQELRAILPARAHERLAELRAELTSWIEGAPAGPPSLELAPGDQRRLGWLQHRERPARWGVPQMVRALSDDAFGALGRVLADERTTPAEATRQLEHSVDATWGPRAEDPPPALFDDHDVFARLDAALKRGPAVFLAGEDHHRSRALQETWAARLRAGDGPRGWWSSGRLVGGLYLGARPVPVRPSTCSTEVIAVSAEPHAGPWIEHARQDGELEERKLLVVGRAADLEAARQRLGLDEDGEVIEIPARTRAQRFVDWLVMSVSTGEAGLVEVLRVFAAAERGRLTLPEVPWHGWDAGRGGPLRGWVDAERLRAPEDFFDEHLARRLEHEHDLTRLGPRVGPLSERVVPGGDLRPFLELVAHLSR